MADTPSQPSKTPPGIFVAIASHDNRWHSNFATSLIRLVDSKRFPLIIKNVASGGVHKARNVLAHMFLTETRFEWMLSADSDIEFHPDHLSRLLARGKPLIGALYCHKKKELEWSLRCIRDVKPDPATGLQRVAAVGTGFLLIHRSVFEKIIADNPEGLTYVEDWSEGHGRTKWDFFPEKVVTEPGYYDEPTFLTEDFGFCWRARRAGFEVLVDTTMHVRHWEGTIGYPDPATVAKQETRPKEAGAP